MLMNEYGVKLVLGITLCETGAKDDTIKNWARSRAASCLPFASLRVAVQCNASLSTFPRDKPSGPTSVLLHKPEPGRSKFSSRQREYAPVSHNARTCHPAADTQFNFVVRISAFPGAYASASSPKFRSLNATKYRSLGTGSCKLFYSFRDRVPLVWVAGPRPETLVFIYKATFFALNRQQPHLSSFPIVSCTRLTPHAILIEPPKPLLYLWPSHKSLVFSLPDR
jgi:hypothetical protein